MNYCLNQNSISSDLKSINPFSELHKQQDKTISTIHRTNWTKHKTRDEMSASKYHEHTLVRTIVSAKVEQKSHATGCLI